MENNLISKSTEELKKLVLDRSNYTEGERQEAIEEIE